MSNKNLLVAEIQVIYKTKIKSSERPVVKDSRTSFQILSSLFDKNTIEMKEQMIMLCLNASNRVIGWFNVSSGGVGSTIIDPKIVFSTALKTIARGIILAHNHPSGSVLPSTSDIDSTKKLIEIGNLLDISILDHLIINAEGDYYSMSDEGNI